MASVTVLAPGVVLIKGALNREQQIFFVNYTLKAGNNPKRGFFVTNAAGERLPNSDRGRSLIYTIDRFPAAMLVRNLCNSIVSTSRVHDAKMPPTTPTHLLLLNYFTAEGMYWHTDSDDNEGDNDHPVVAPLRASRVDAHEPRFPALH